MSFSNSYMTQSPNPNPQAGTSVFAPYIVKSLLKGIKRKGNKNLIRHVKHDCRVSIRHLIIRKCRQSLWFHSPVISSTTTYRSQFTISIEAFEHNTRIICKASNNSSSFNCSGFGYTLFCYFAKPIKRAMYTRIPIVQTIS